MPYNEILEREYEELGGGLSVYLTDGKPEDWNVRVPGRWRPKRPPTVADVGSYISDLLESEPGVYRLIGLDDGNKPAIIQRACGSDRSGTLYIGCDYSLWRGRLPQLVRSLRTESTEHPAGARLRGNSLLAARYPISKLALTWCYIEQHKKAERALLHFYFRCFGDDPPLNRR
jgi:hypothetical protein